LRRRFSPVVALFLTGALFVTGVAGPASARVASGSGDESSVTLHPLWVRQTPNGSEGGATEITIRLRRTESDAFRVGFTEDSVAGTGDQWRAAGWSAAVVATLLTGSDLGGVEITFDLTGRIDGPSAGALMTAGVIALLRGDEVQDDITMTGTINPDGTVGPVGGIPYKLDGAVAADKSRVLVPLGQRMSPDDTGEPVDVVELGQTKELEVAEAGNIYEVYEAFTGEVLPRPEAAGAIELTEDANAALESHTAEWLAEYTTQGEEFNTLDPEARDNLISIAERSNEAANLAQELTQQGFQAGAYVTALEAAAYARAAVVTGGALSSYAEDGIDAFRSEIRSDVRVDQKIDDLLSLLKEKAPATVGDASALISAYGYTVDAMGLTLVADNLFDASEEAESEDDALAAVIIGATFYQFAGVLAEAAEEVFEIGATSSSSPELDEEAIPLEKTASFFRKAASANREAFAATVVKSIGEQEGLSTDTASALLSRRDFGYALAEATFLIIESDTLRDVLGGGPNAAYGELGGTVQLYVRTSALISKYYSLVGGSCLDEQLEPTCAKDQALAFALAFGDDQAARSISSLQALDIDTTLETAVYEEARLDSQGTLDDQLDAQGDFLAAFIKSRVLAYLGGFQDQGIEDAAPDAGDTNGASSTTSTTS
jgi:hypothetical protein